VRRVGPRVKDLPDEALLAGFAAGDPEVAGAFVQAFQPKVYGVARRIVADPRMAEDVAQAAFERAWRHARTYDPRRGSVSAWIGVIARNLAIDAVRVRPVTPVDATVLLELMTTEDAGPSGPERAALEAESVARLRAALRALPIDQARAVVLAGIAGLSASQVAANEDIPLGTAKTRIRTAMLKLRDSLETATRRA
jgi:RNA polymerase sigma factor (sigma-70 family)